MKLLNIKPLDKYDRIIQMTFTYRDLTEIGKKAFESLYCFWLKYFDETSSERKRNIKMLKKNYSEIIEYIKNGE
jgi:hypothetical protein